MAVSTDGLDTATPGGATAANQTTEISALQSLDGKLPAAAVPADGAANAESATSIRARMSGLNVGGTWDRIRQSITGAITVFTGYLNVIPVTVYRAVRNTTAEGGGQELQGNTRGDLSTAEAFRLAGEDNANDVLKITEKAQSNSTDVWTGYESGTTKIGATAGITIKASAGRLRRIGGENASTTAVYWLVCVNKATAPANNDAVVASCLLPHQLAASPATPAPPLDFGIGGKYFSTGISFAISTTPEKVTLGASDCHVWADYA